jgi:peptidoglycan/LPS O-acetylase OafA/YrhL
MLAFWVLAGHTMAASGLTLPLLSKAPIAVDIFMLVSGFLMAFYFRVREDKEPWESPGTWGNFYIRRFFRIAPAYYLILAVALLFRGYFQKWHFEVITAFPPPWANVVHESATLPALGWQDVVSHVTFLFGFIPKYASSDAIPDWSIGLEMQFYLALPFIMLLLRRTGHVVTAVVLLGLWLGANSLISVYAGSAPKMFGPFPQPTFLPLKLNCFLVGILLAESYHFRALSRKKSTLLLVMSFAVALGTATKIMFSVTVLSAVMLAYPPAGAATGAWRAVAWCQRKFDSGFCSFLGDTSYGVYLLHNLFILPLAAWVLTKPAIMHLPQKGRFLLLLGCVAGIAYPIAYLVHRFVERPGIALGRKLIRRNRGSVPRMAEGAPLVTGIPVADAKGS